MCPHDGCVDHHMFKVGIVGQGLEKTLPNAFTRPSSEAHVDAVPITELGRQIAPRRARSQNPQHAIHKQPIVPACPPFVAFLARHQLLNTHPLSVREFAPNQDRLLQFAILNHIRESEGIL